MNYSIIIFVQSAVFFFLPVLLLPSLLLSLYYGDNGFSPFLQTMFISLGSGVVFYVAYLYINSRIPGEMRKRIKPKEAYVSVALAWLTASLMGCLPFIFLAEHSLSFINAFFETVSGFTTTGSTVIPDVTIYAKSILFWRAFTQWIGGMGIILLALAILPMIGVGGQQLYAAEVPGPLSSKITTTITQTAKLLWFVYLLISVMEAVSLYAGGMTLYDAVTHTFTTLATGGYSVRNESLAYYSPLLQYIVIFFMFLAGINFSLHYFAFKGSPLSYFKNSEFRFYLFVLLIAAGFIYLNTESIITDPLSRLRHVLFQTVSITTTTGYCSFNFDKWPDFSRLVLVGLMFIGGSGGSTGGGIKCIRVMILFKYFIIQIRKILHPKQVIPLKIGGNVIADKVVNTIVNFILIYIMIVIIAVFIVASQGYDLITSFSSIAATINNIGPGLAGVGAEANFAHLNTITKVVHIACMLAGRLELIAFIILFYPGTWMKH